MTSAEKLLAKMRRLPPDMPFAEVQKVLECLGWALDRVRGSHHVLVRNGDTLSVPRSSGKVKRIYLQQILDRQ